MPTPPEAKLWARLRRRQQLGVKFRRQVPMRGYIADFYAPQAHLVVEVDGSSHEDRQVWDAQRDAALRSAGIQTLRFPAWMVERQLGLVLREIRYHLTKYATNSGLLDSRSRRDDI